MTSGGTCVISGVSLGLSGHLVCCRCGGSVGDNVGDIVGGTDEETDSVDGEEVQFGAVDESKSPDANADLLCRRRWQQQRWTRMRVDRGRSGGKPDMGEERNLLRRC